MMRESSCVNCNAAVPQGVRFCDNCGMPVSEAAPTQEAPPREDLLRQPPAPSLTLAPRSSPPPAPPSSVGQPIPDLSLPQEAPAPPAAREDDKPGWRRYRVPILLLLPLLLTLLLAGTAYALIGGTNEHAVGVADLVDASSVGKPQGVAGGNVEASQDTGVESQEPQGPVVEQDPPAGETADEGSIISSVDDSKGANLPDVRGKARDEAVRLLERAGFEVKEETEESTAANEGYVTKQDPQGGEREFAEAGSTVKITLGARPARQTPEKATSSAPKQTPVSDGVGEKVEEAKQPPEKPTSSAPKPEAPPPLPDTEIEEPKTEPPPSLPDTKAEEPKTEPPPPPPDTKAEEPKAEPASASERIVSEQGGT